MTLILDAGALIAVERRDKATIARLLRAHETAEPVVTSAVVVAQVLRSPAKQVTLTKVLTGVEEVSFDRSVARRVGKLLAQTHTSDVVDAAVAGLAEPGDEVLTSDPNDLKVLIQSKGVRLTIV
jgi:predicted nucleic acid-binding protein